MNWNENQDSFITHHEWSRTLRAVSLSKVSQSRKSVPEVSKPHSFEMLTLVSGVS